MFHAVLFLYHRTKILFPIVGPHNSPDSGASLKQRQSPHLWDIRSYSLTHGKLLVKARRICIKKKTLSKRGINFFQKLLRRYLLDAMSSTDRDQSFHPCERKNVPLFISSLRTMRQTGHVQSRVSRRNFKFDFKFTRRTDVLNKFPRNVRRSFLVDLRHIEDIYIRFPTN